MKKPAFFTCTLLALGVLSATLGFGKDKILVKNGEKIAFLGDSITANGWNQPGGYVRLIVDALAKQGITVSPIPAGVSGNTSKDMLARLDSDVLNKDPNWMTLSCGVNDVWHGVNGVELGPYETNITAIVDRARTAGVRVVILTATPIGEDVESAGNKKLVAYNQFLQKLATKYNLPLADLNANFQSVLSKSKPGPASRILTVDGVHMNPEGNLLMAEGCLRALGVSDARLKEIEEAWLTQTNTAMLNLGIDPRPVLGVTFGQFRILQKEALNRNTDVMQLNNTLWLQALGEAIQSHQQDKIIDEERLKAETDACVLRKIDALSEK